MPHHQGTGGRRRQVEVENRQRNIEALTLRGHRDGYASWTRTLGQLSCPGHRAGVRVGDWVRASMAVAEIPDLKNWELTAALGELDRGHLAVDQKVDVTVVALPGHPFHGRVKDLGGTGGPPWDRHLECRMRLDDPILELRPGMSVEVVITTDLLRNALWIPAQVLFESGSRTYVFTPSGNGFAPRRAGTMSSSSGAVRARW